MLPLRSVGRSNFVMVCVNKFNNVDSKATYFDENCCVIHIYIYSVFLLIVQFIPLHNIAAFINICRFLNQCC